MFLRFIIVLNLVFVPCAAQAKYVSGDDPTIAPVLTAEGVKIDDDMVMPVEPNLVEITFLKEKPSYNLRARIKRLTHGIETDIPPEYDVYGYEIRRYMASVGNIKVYQDEDFLIKQIRNVRKAAIILDYWHEHVLKEMREIEQEIVSLSREGRVPSTDLTAFRQNKRIVRGFMIDARSWIDSNERLLMDLFDNYGLYQLVYPEIQFIRPALRIDLYNIFQLRQVNLREIRKYQAFSIMVY